MAQIARKFDDRKTKLAAALKKFRPRKGDRGKIIFIGVNGGRLEYNSSRRGYAVYVDGKGRKIEIRQRNRNGEVEQTAIPRKITSIDISRARSKRAKADFLTARLNPIASKELRRKGRKGVTSRGTRYAGAFQTDKFYDKADCVTVMSEELAAASNAQRSKRDFLVTIGISVSEGKGKSRKFHWLELQRRFSRADGQEATVSECRQFFGREVYAFLARELSDRDLVLQGSARHIGMLKCNRGNPRNYWRKDGFLWQGHDQKNVRIEKVEYRIDQLKLGK